MSVLRLVLGYLIAIAIVLLRTSCRIRRHGDPRPELRSKSQPYAYSLLHAHQVSAMIDGEAGTGAMVSRSQDGALIIPSLRARGILPIRGSTRLNGDDKGGGTAFNSLIAHVKGGAPAYFAVDGPRGPRSHVRKGIALLSQKTGAAVLNIVPVPTRRWILTGAWDRLQIPMPFSCIDVYFGEPLFPRDDEDLEQYRERIECALVALERQHDLDEANRSEVAARPPGVD